MSGPLFNEYGGLFFNEYIQLCTRGDGGTASVKVDEDWAKENLHVYAFCVSADGKDASRTKYVSLA